MAKLRLVAAVLVFTSATALAQSGDFTPATKATPDQIHELLKSEDPRHVAWGAYFASKQEDETAIAMMLEMVANWAPPQDPGSPEDAAWSSSMLAILDVLIQRGVLVPTASLAALANVFPAKIFILASRHPISEITPLLLAWYSARNDGQPGYIARPAAMMLSKAPPPGFAATVLDEAEEHLTVVVRDDDLQYGVGWGSSACCGGSAVPLPGWPPAASYCLQENKPGADPVIVDAGGDSISYGLGAGCSCSTPRPLTDETRRRLLAEMSGLSASTMAWKPEQNVFLRWNGRDQFLRELQDLISSEETKLLATVRALYEKRLLIDSEASSRPKLSITVRDERIEPDPPLPTVVSREPKTVLTFTRSQP